MVITVSAGTTTGFGSIAFFTAVFAASAMDGEEELASGPACWSAGFWHPATSMPTDKADTQIVARRRFIKSSTGWTVFFKHTLIHCEVNLPYHIGQMLECCSREQDQRYVPDRVQMFRAAEFIVVYGSLNPSSLRFSSPAA